MKTILFICTGNVCRSPMAEALFRRAVERTRRVPRAFGGPRRDGRPAAHAAFGAAMRELGVDISAQRSRMLTADLVRQADLFWA